MWINEETMAIWRVVMWSTLFLAIAGAYTFECDGGFTPEPFEFNKPDGEEVHPICPGDFKLYYEFWEVEKDKLVTGHDKVTLPSKYGETWDAKAFEGPLKVNSGLYFTLYNEDRYMYSIDQPNAEKHWIWARETENPGLSMKANPMRNPEYEFAFGTRLFYNSTHFIELEKMYEKRKEDTSQKYVEIDSPPPAHHISEIPPDQLSENMKQKVQQYCGSNYCAVDMNSDGSSMVMDSKYKIAFHQSGMDLIARSKSGETGWSEPHYLIRHAGNWFYFPKNLKTFTDENGWWAKMNNGVEDWNRRFLLLPIVHDDDPFFQRSTKWTTTVVFPTTTKRPPTTTAAPSPPPTTTVRTTTTPKSPLLGYARVAVKEEPTTPSPTTSGSMKSTVQSLMFLVFGLLISLVVR
ncbi:hypothetical protein M3Y94_00701000 [Aphelenchoides besseyi]|nr:hypothetical protein M3Y94_00701000 [Aphelenchoides besseyi]KAI6231618.1 hypothetical protein M3Y95_00401000 [Aphelenchoides besseyi]